MSEHAAPVAPSPPSTGGPKRAAAPHRKRATVKTPASSSHASMPEAEPAPSVPSPPFREEPEANEEDMLEQIDPEDLQFFEIIGSGVTAKVFRGRWEDKVVAIKQIFKARRMDVKEQVRFAREVHVLAKVDHPNLVKLYGVCLLRHPYQIVTELCEGGELFQLLHNSIDTELSWSQRIKMCIDVAEAMNYLHNFDPQIIHRDLKSLNLLLDRALVGEALPDVKVSDFGLSRMKDPADARGQMTYKVGTLHWMAPEIFSRTDYDETVDVYSFAIVLFEVICREPPFLDEDPGSIETFVSKGGRPCLDAVPDDCPEPLLGLMQMCWAHDSCKRPPFSSITRQLEDIMFSGAELQHCGEVLTL